MKQAVNCEMIAYRRTTCKQMLLNYVNKIYLLLMGQNVNNNDDIDVDDGCNINNIK